MHEMHLRYSSRELYLSRTVRHRVRFVCSTLLIFPAGSAVLEMRRIYSLSCDLTLPVRRVEERDQRKNVGAREIGWKVRKRRNERSRKEHKGKSRNLPS